VAHSHHSHHHDHEHDHGHHDHGHDEHHGHVHGHAHGKSLTWALLLTLLFAFVEVLGGWWSGSLALLSDAGHMFSDVAALGLAAFAQWVSRKPPSARHSYGLARAEVVAALLNGVLMLAVIVWIVVESVQRLLLPHPVSGGTVMLVAFAGLAVNVFVALVLSHGEQSLNSRAALLHVMGDLLGSVAALIAGAVIHYTGWTPIDPLLSVLVAALILISTINLLRHTLHALLDGVPQGLELSAIGRRLAGLPGVLSVHDLHVWSLGGERIALSAHMRLSALEQWPQTLAHARAMLHRDYRISHVTLQPETDTEFNTGFQLRVPIHIGEPTHHQH
jgi:cobalt-zinc-cadmium efflux system protein